MQHMTSEIQETTAIIVSITDIRAVNSRSTDGRIVQDINTKCFAPDV